MSKQLSLVSAVIFVSFQLSFAQSIEPSLFPVNTQSSTVFIDQKGVVVLTVPYEAGRFSEGLARVNVNGKTGYIDRSGTFVIEPQEIRSLDFSQGLARFYGGPPCGQADDKSYFGFIGRDGQVVIPPKLSHPCNYYGDAFDFKAEGLVLTQVGDKWGFADKTGKIVLEFERAGHFAEGLAPVRIEGKLGFVDPNGRVVITPQFEDALPFSEGLAAVRLNDKSGFIDRTGRIVIAPQFQQAVGFRDGMAAVQINEKWGYIDRSGKVVVPPGNNWTYAQPFSNGRAVIEIDRERGYIDRTGKVIIEPQFHWSEDFRDGLALVNEAETGRRAYIDVQGKIVYQFPEPNRPPPDLNNPHVKIGLSTDVAWLESVASPLKHTTHQKPGAVPNRSKDLSAASYARLGALKTDESIAAVKRIEELFRSTAVQTPKFVSLDVSLHPGWHFSDTRIKPLAQIKNDRGVAYALVADSLMGDLDLFLVSNQSPDDPSTWTRPKLVAHKFYRGLEEPALAIKGDELIFSFTQGPPPGRALMEGTHDPGPTSPVLGRRRVNFSIKDIEKDSDKDGWTDLEEARLGLDPQKPDSDGDGVSDGQDGCPNFAPTPGDLDSEENQILERAVFAVFGLSGSRYLLLVGPESKRINVWGYGGPVLYGHDVKSWMAQHQYGGVFVNWRIRKKSGSQATVEVSDYEGPLAAGGVDVRLQKINNEWFVIGKRATWVS